MKTRIISSIVIIGPMLVFVFFGGIPLLLFCLALSAIGMWEFYKGYAAEGVKAGKVGAFILLAALYAIIGFGEFTELAPSTYTHLIQMWVFGAVFLGLIMTLIRKDHNILDGSVTTIGLLYIGYFFAHLVLISGIRRYHLMVWIVFIAAFGQDTFAYFTGYFFGKHKMAPNISPKKTIEGAVGGVIGATVLCGLFGLIVFSDGDNIFLHCLIMGFFGAFFGMAGDLIASAFKRKMGIKDYGNLIPGHGGILDRFDSVLLVAPFVYYYILLFVRP